MDCALLEDVFHVALIIRDRFQAIEPLRTP